MDGLKFDDRALDIVASIYASACAGRSKANIIYFICNMHCAGVSEELARAVLVTIENVSTA
jgi:hypothetical protein